MCGAARAAVTVVILQCIISILVVAQLRLFSYSADNYEGGK